MLVAELYFNVHPPSSYSVAWWVVTKNKVLPWYFPSCIILQLASSWNEQRPISYPITTDELSLLFCHDFLLRPFPLSRYISFYTFFILFFFIFSHLLNLAYRFLYILKFSGSNPVFYYLRFLICVCVCVSTLPTQEFTVKCGRNARRNVRNSIMRCYLPG